MQSQKFSPFPKYNVKKRLKECSQKDLVSAQMAIVCGICLPVKILIVEFSETQEQTGTSLKIICWLFQLSQTSGFVIVDICLLMVTIGRYLFVYKTHVALAIRHNLRIKISIIVAILLFTMSRGVIR